MKKINKNTQQAQGIIWSYEHADNSGRLEEVYQSYSAAKARAYRYCLELKEKLNGFDARITGANTFFFSYAFQYCDEDGVLHLAYITHANDYTVEL